MRHQSKQYTAPLGIFLISLLFFIWGVYPQEIISFDSRFYLFAQEMWRHGVSWFPTTYSQPYPDYTVTSTLLIYLFATALGGLSKLAAVLPSALAAAVTTMLTYQIGALHHKRWGWYAVGFLFMTIMFIKSARAIALDMYPCAITTACFYLVHSAKILNKPKRSLWIYPLLVLGFVFRGPIGLVMPTGVVCFYYLLDRQLKRFFTTGLIAFSMLIICVIGLLALAYHVGGVAFMQDVFRMQVAGRMGVQFLPVYFYFTNSLINYALAYPFALLVMLGIFYYRRKLVDYAFLAKLTAWALVILVGMSIPGEKKIRYVLPMVPALALLAAYPFVDVIKQRYFVYLRAIAMIFILLLPVLFAYASLRVGAIVGHADLLIFYPSSLPVFFGVMQVVSIVAYFTVKKSQRMNIAFCVALFCFLTAYFKLIEPIELAIDRGRNFVAYIEAVRQQDDAQLVFYRERPDGLPIKYLVNMSGEANPVFLGTYDELQAYHARALLVTSKSYFDSLDVKQKRAFNIVATGKLGHDNVVVFRR